MNEEEKKLLLEIDQLKSKLFDLIDYPFDGKIYQKVTDTIIEKIDTLYYKFKPVYLNTCSKEEIYFECKCAGNYAMYRSYKGNVLNIALSVDLNNNATEPILLKLLPVLDEIIKLKIRMKVELK